MKLDRPPRLVRRLLLLLLCLGVVGGGVVSTAHAKLDNKAWKELEARYKEVFTLRGAPREKEDVLKEVLADGTGRAWRLLADALFNEVQVWWSIQQEMGAASKEHGEVMQRGIKGYTAVDEARAKELQARLKLLEADAKEEREVLDIVVRIVSEGPQLLLKNILRRAKSGGEWPDRAAAVRVAVATMGEKLSWSYLQNTIENDPDPRVRMAGLDALRTVEDRWEDLVIGRLGDPEWAVVLMAARIATERELHKAVPHLINAMSGASPRVAEGLGVALRSLTGENFEAYMDVWSRWWEEHKDEFKADVRLKAGKASDMTEVHFYGVPIKSDRVLFIIDISGSMKKPTTNDNPKERWKPPPQVTGGGNHPPPPPPPEEILSGPKIDVAKHELKKAITKLPKDWTFNIIAFNQAAVHWQKGMMKATDKNKEDAAKWIRSLKPHGSTYIDGALRLGFKIAGLLDFDKRYPELAVDTIVLLSDGAPTDNAFPVSKLMDPEEILSHVREWNKNKHVVVHAIGVDMVEGIEFLRKLAAENGGTYVDR